MHLVHEAFAYKLAQRHFERLTAADFCVAIRSEDQHMSRVQVSGQEQKQAQAGRVRPVQIVEQYDKEVRLGSLMKLLVALNKRSWV